jgi:tetratricopeptide (TPR) repeat protein
MLELWAGLLPFLSGALTGLSLSYLKPAILRAPRPASIVIASVALLLTRLGIASTLLALLVGGVVALLGEPRFMNLGTRRPIVSWSGVAVAGACSAAALALLLAARPALGPAPAFLLTAGVAWVLGACVNVPRALATVVGVGALAHAGAVLAGQLQVGAWGLSLPVGLSSGLLVRAWARGGSILLVPMVAALGALPLVRSLPPSWQARGGAAQVSVSPGGGLGARFDALRSRARATTEWSWSGATQWWDAGGIRLVELDGAAVGASSRSAAAERLAATMVGCAARPRGRVRVVGDDFGRAAVVLREAGFSGIDVAAPDVPLARALAAGDADARHAWLSVDVRLLHLPPAALLGAAGRVSAVLEVVRVGWRDARTAWPDGGALARSASHVEDGGAHVLLLPGLGVELGALRDTLHAFAALWPVVGAYSPPEGAEALVVVGTQEAVAWDTLSLCARSASWMRAYGGASPIELGGLLIADQHTVAALPAGSPPGVSLPSERDLLPVAALFPQSAESDHVFSGPVPRELAARQATRRASLQVLRASATGDVRSALQRAQDLADDPGGGVAVDPMVEPLLDRARTLASRAASEGERSASWAEADAAIEAALLMNPGSAAARCLRGDLAFARKRADEALRWYSECAERDPGDWRAFQGVGAAQRALGRDEEAEVALRESARLAPESWSVQLNLGSFLRQVGQVEEAERVLRRAEYLASATSEAGRTRAHLALARLYLQTTRPDLALAEARRAEVDEPGADSAFWMGAAQYELRAWADAEASYRLALRRNERLIDAREGLGLCLARRGDYLGAAEAFRAVLAVDPRRTLAREKLDLLKPLLGAQAEGVRSAGGAERP